MNTKEYNIKSCADCPYFHCTTSVEEYSSVHTSPWGGNSTTASPKLYYMRVYGYASCDMGAFHRKFYSFTNPYDGITLATPKTEEIAKTVMKLNPNLKCPQRHCYVGSSYHNDILLDRLETILYSEGIDDIKVDTILRQFGEVLANINR